MQGQVLCEEDQVGISCEARSKRSCNSELSGAFPLALLSTPHPADLRFRHQSSAVPRDGLPSPWVQYASENAAVSANQSSPLLSPILSL